MSKIIHGVKEDKGKLLVHCRSSISRATVFVIAYLMEYEKMSAEEATRFVLQKRSVTHPNDGFVKQLIEFEEELKH